MSHGGELFELSGAEAAASGFETARLGGYRKDQVDRYVAIVEREIQALEKERHEAFAHAEALSTQSTVLHQEIGQLRRHLATGQGLTFRHLGPTVEQILTLAEEQAESIRQEASREISGKQSELDRLIQEAHERAAEATADFEITLAARRQDEERATAQRREAIAAEVTAAREYAEQLTAEARATVQQAEAEARRITDAATAYVSQVRAEADQYAQNVRAQLEQEQLSRRATMQQEYQALRTEADQYAQAVRAQAEAQASAIASHSDEHAQSVRTHTEQVASQLRAEAAEHGGATRAAAPSRRASRSPSTTGRASGCCSSRPPRTPVASCSRWRPATPAAATRT